MDLTLTRRYLRPDGIFSFLTRTDNGERVAVTLEHAYPEGVVYRPKLPNGKYTCQKGIHQLERGGPFEAFEVMNVPGHKGILFHIGNYNKDSDGCILLGEVIIDTNSVWWITESGLSFRDFMKLQEGCQEFILEVT